MGKFGLRGAGAIDGARAFTKESMSRDFVIGWRHPRAGGRCTTTTLTAADPDAIAETYWATLQQHRSAWEMGHLGGEFLERERLGRPLAPLLRSSHLLWVIRYRDEAGSRSGHFGCAAESGSKIRVLVSCRDGPLGLMASPARDSSFQTEPRIIATNSPPQRCKNFKFCTSGASISGGLERVGIVRQSKPALGPPRVSACASANIRSSSDRRRVVGVEDQPPLRSRRLAQTRATFPERASVIKFDDAQHRQVDAPALTPS